MPQYENGLATNSPDTGEQTQAFQDAAEHHGSVSAAMERYGGDISQCPYLQSLGSAGVALVEQLQAAEKDPNRGPTISEVLAAKKAEREKAETPPPSETHEQITREYSPLFDTAQQAETGQRLHSVDSMKALEAQPALAPQTVAVKEYPVIEAEAVIASRDPLDEVEVAHQLRETLQEEQQPDKISAHGPAEIIIQSATRPEKTANPSIEFSVTSKIDHTETPQKPPQPTQMTMQNESTASRPLIVDTVKPAVEEHSPQIVIPEAAETAAEQIHADIVEVEAEQAPNAEVGFSEPVPETIEYQVSSIDEQPPYRPDDEVISQDFAEAEDLEASEPPIYFELGESEEALVIPDPTETILEFLAVDQLRISEAEEPDEPLKQSGQEVPQLGADSLIATHIKHLDTETKQAAATIITKIQELTDNASSPHIISEEQKLIEEEITALYSELGGLLSPEFRKFNLSAHFFTELSGEEMPSLQNLLAKPKEKGTMEYKTSISSKLTSYLSAALAGSRYFSYLGNCVLKNHIAVDSSSA